MLVCNMYFMIEAVQVAVGSTVMNGYPDTLHIASLHMWFDSWRD